LSLPRSSSSSYSSGEDDSHEQEREEEKDARDRALRVLALLSVGERVTRELHACFFRARVLMAMIVLLFTPSKGEENQEIRSTDGYVRASILKI